MVYWSVTTVSKTVVDSIHVNAPTAANFQISYFYLIIILFYGEFEIVLHILPYGNMNSIYRVGHVQLQEGINSNNNIDKQNQFPNLLLLNANR